MFDWRRRPMGRLYCWVLLVFAACGFGLRAWGAAAVPQSGPATTTVADTVYLADGSTAEGALIITWPAFLTAGGTAVGGGTTNATLGANGALSVALVPNAGASPAGSYYTVVYQLGPGEVRTEYWVVPTTSPANLATVRTTPGAGVAAQPASMQYVDSELAVKANDNAVVHLGGTETISGAKTFATTPSVPAPTGSGQVANKGYVDQSVSNAGAGVFLPTAGGAMTGPITLPGNPAAPLQASTKQYVDTGLAAKSDLISGLVPVNELGTGLANSGTCLLGNGTWGACSGTGGGTGNLSTSPGVSQNIAQPVGTQFSTNNLANIRYVMPSWNWAQTPADSLVTPGNLTIHLSPCPLGLDTVANANYYTYKVYISGTGTAEAVPVTGGNCPPGASSGTITVTTAYAHGAGYTVGSASTGIQEAWNDAWVSDSGAGAAAASVSPYVKLAAGALYNVYASVYLRGRGGILDGEGALIACYTRDRCLYVGTTQAHPYVAYHTLYKLTGAAAIPVTNQPGSNMATVSASSGTFTVTTAAAHSFLVGDTVDCEYYSTSSTGHFAGQIIATGFSSTQFEITIPSATTFSAGAATFGFCNLLNAFIEDNSDHVVMDDIQITNNSLIQNTGAFTFGIVNDNDQHLMIEHPANRGLGSINGNYPVSAFVYQRADAGNAGITYIHAGEFSNINCVTGASNGLVVTDTVCQAFPAFGFRYFGGLEPATFQNIYQEAAPGMVNPLYGYGAAMGYLIQGGQGSRMLGTWPSSGYPPVFSCSGSTASTVRNYFVVPHEGSAGAYPAGPGPVLYIGSSSTTTCGGSSVPLMWPNVELYADAGGNPPGTITWDVLVTTGASTLPPMGTGSFAVATNISGSCGNNGMCSYTDTQSGTSSYTVQTETFAPLFWFWPTTFTINNTVLLADQAAGTPSAVASQGIAGVSIIADQCISAGTAQGQRSPIWVSCLTSANGGGAGSIATVLQQQDTANGGPTSNSKGRLNFGKALSSTPNDLITLQDSNFTKTLTTAGQRPSNDAGDMAIGLDQSGGLALRAATSISTYVNAIPSGSNFVERLSSGSETFNVPVTVNGNLSVTGSYTGALTESQITNLTSDLAGKVSAASPTFTGTVTVPTATPLTNNTQVASTGYADAAVSVEKTRALAAEATLAPLASPGFTGSVTLPVTGASAQCLHVSASGALSGTGADCGSGTGTVNSGMAAQLAMYPGNGAAVSGDSAVTDNGTTLNYAGSGGIAATAGTFSGNLTVNGQLLVAGPWMVSSPIPGTAMPAAATGTSALGVSNDGNFYISASGGTPQKVATTTTSSYFSNLFQEDANDLGEYNVSAPTTAQNLHVYSSYTNSSTWQRTTLGFDSGTGYAALKSESSGTAPGLGFWVNGLKWLIDGTYNLKPWADEVYNIGTFSGTTGIGLRPATVYAAGAANSDSGFELGKFANNSYELCNDTTNGTMLNGLAMLTANGCAVKPSSAATSGVIGVVIANAGTSGTTTLVRTGSAYCSFDAAATVVGDYVVASSTANSGFYPLCHDAGSAQPSGVQVLGRVLQATSGSTSAQMFFDMPGSNVSSGAAVSSAMWTLVPDAGNVAGALASSAGNKAEVWGVNLTFPLSTSQVTYEISTNADNTATYNYDLGLYNASGTLVLNVNCGTLHGSTFAPATATPETQSWCQGTKTLTPGQYYLFYYSSNTTTTPPAFYSTSSGVTFYKAESGSSGAQGAGGLGITPGSGGALPGSITPPANVYSWFAYIPALIIH